MKPNYSLTSQSDQKHAPLFYCGFLFSGFSCGGFWGSVGVFYDCCDWGFETWWNYNNALCVSKTALMSFVEAHPPYSGVHYQAQFDVLRLRIYLVGEVIFCGEECRKWQIWLAASFSKKKKKEKIGCVQLCISHQTESGSFRSVSQGIKS